MKAYRIADRRFPLLDGNGALLCGGRWNSRGKRVVYAAATYAGALLEQLAHANLGRLPKTQNWVEIDIPADIAFDRVEPDEIPEWDADHMINSRARGDRWLDERKTAILLVPSAVTGGIEINILINPDHPDAQRITATEPAPVVWDPRLVRR